MEQFDVVSKVPLADAIGLVTACFHNVGNGPLFRIETDDGVGLMTCLGQVGLKTETAAKAAGQQPGTRWRTDRIADVAPGEAYPVLEDGVNVGRVELLASLYTQVGIAKVIGQNQDDVRLVGRRCQQRHGPDRQYERDASQTFHRLLL